MVSIFLTLLLLAGSFLLVGGFVRFSENVIRPPAADRGPPDGSDADSDADEARSAL